MSSSKQQSETKHMSKALRTAMKMVGDTWVLCIVCNLAEKGLRFSEIQRAVDGINPVTLTRRLKELELEQIVRREEETLDKLSVVYELTEKGKAIIPVIKQINEFAKQFTS